MSAAAPVLEVADLHRTYRVRRGLFRAAAALRAVDGVSLSLDPGRTLAVVGESGCGKSTLARMLALLDTPTSGTIRIEGADTATTQDGAKQALRRSVQMVFQDPFGSLNPRRTVSGTLEEPLIIAGEGTGAERRAAVLEMMARVGLRPDQAGRYPHMFSGGQRQRIAIARALMLRPRLVVADEPVSALDVSVRAQVLNLLMDLQDGFGLAYVLISHDLGVVRHVADTVAVMYLGRIVEQAARDTVFAEPRHPYTRALLAATPGAAAFGLLARSRAAEEPVRGEPPSPLAPPPGCPYHTRCPHTVPRCRESVPVLRQVDASLVACHRAEEIA